MLHTLIRRVAPVAVLALGAVATAGCNGNVRFGDSEGVPLAELDRSGAAPTELVLAGPDNVTVVEGGAFGL